MKSEHNIETVIALLQQLLVQNEQLAGEVALLKAQLDLLEHKLDTIAEEAGMI